MMLYIIIGFICCAIILGFLYYKISNLENLYKDFSLCKQSDNIKIQSNPEKKNNIATTNNKSCNVQKKEDNNNNPKMLHSDNNNGNNNDVPHDCTGFNNTDDVISYTESDIPDLVDSHIKSISNSNVNVQLHEYLINDELKDKDILNKIEILQSPKICDNDGDNNNYNISDFNISNNEKLTKTSIMKLRVIDLKDLCQKYNISTKLSSGQQKNKSQLISDLSNKLQL